MKYQSKCIGSFTYNSRDINPPVEFVQFHDGLLNSPDYLVSDINQLSFVSKKGDQWFTYKFEVFK